MTGYILLASTALISFLFGRGEFGTVSIEKTALCLCGYAFALVPSTWVLILASVHFSFGHFKKTAFASMVTLGANVAFNTVFIFVLGMGAESVAFATALAATVNAIILLKTLPFSMPPLLPLLKTTLATIAAFTACFFAPFYPQCARTNARLRLYLLSLLSLLWVHFSSEDLLFWKHGKDPNHFQLKR